MNVVWLMRERMVGDTALIVRTLRSVLAMNQASFGELFGVNQSTVGRWEKGAEMGAANYRRLVELGEKYLDHNPELDKAILAERVGTVPVRGVVGAGSIVYNADHDASSHDIDWVLSPRNTGDLIAVLVRGDSMYPVYRDGDVIFFQRHDGALSTLLGEECLIRTSDDKQLIKILERGSADHLFNLISYNGPPMRDQEVIAAYPVAYIQRRRNA